MHFKGDAFVKRFDNLVEEFYRKVPYTCKLSFLSAIIAGFAAHMYMFTNKLPNYDDMALNGFGATFRLGRWFLWVLGACAYHLDLVYSLPWINGIAALVLMALSAAIIVELLGISSKINIMIVSSLLVVFPSWTATYFFMYTAPYYAIAVMLSALSVFMTVRLRRGFWAGIALQAFSLGIYQAYLPFTVTLYVIILVFAVLNNSINVGTLVKNAIKYLFTLVFGILLYYIIMKLSLAITHQQLADYKGVSQMGVLSFETVQVVLRAIIFNGFGAIWNNNIEISYNLVLKLGYLISALLLLFCFIVKAVEFIKAKEAKRCLFLTAMLSAYCIAVNSIYIMSPEDGAVYSIMTYAYVFMLIFPMCFLDIIFTEKMLPIEYICKLMGIVVVLNYCHFANAQYLSMDLSLRQAISYFNTMITQVKSVEGYSDKLPVAFAGAKVKDAMLYENEVMDIFDISGRDDVLAYAYSREYLLAYYCGFSPEYVAIDGLDREKIRQMPCYPLDGGIKVIDGVIVIKLSDE